MLSADESKTVNIAREVVRVNVVGGIGVVGGVVDVEVGEEVVGEVVEVWVVGVVIGEVVGVEVGGGGSCSGIGGRSCR